MRKDASCEILIDTDTKMSWYSSDISVDVLKEWQKEGGDCKPAPGADPTPYERGWPLVMGEEDVATDTNPYPQEGVL